MVLQGVLEAAVRTACHLTTGKEADLPDYEELRGFSGLKEAEVLLKDRKLKVAIAHGTGNARVLLERLRAGETFHFVEIMACPGGCVGEAGSPFTVAGNARKYPWTTGITGPTPWEGLMLPKHCGGPMKTRMF